MVDRSARQKGQAEMRKKMIVVWALLGAAAAIAGGYVLGRGLIRLQDRNDPPIIEE
jgi:hypothetical protein